MPEKSEWLKDRIRRKDFEATPLGKALTKFETAHAHFWQLDATAAPYSKALDRADVAMQAARRELIDLVTKHQT